MYAAERSWLAGTVDEIKASERSMTGAYLSGRRLIAVPEQRRPISDKRIKITGATHNNLKNVDVEIPLGAFVCYHRCQRVRKSIDQQRHPVGSPQPRCEQGVGLAGQVQEDQQDST